MLYEVEVINNKKESPSAYTLILSKPQGFTFLPGQFVHLQTTIDDKPIRRSYSIASAPHQKHIHISIRIQEHGRVSPVLAQIPVGSQLKMIGPFGLFTRTQETHSLFIAAGTGVTPFISYLQEAKHQQDIRKATLLYSNKTQQDMLYHTQLQELAANNWFSYYPTLTQEQWDNNNGRISKEDIKKHLTKDTVIYLCGSNAFVRAMNQLLIELNVSVENIRTENYGNITS